ncbi:MAG: transglycosylase domain-containing protein [Candidatus Gracilibacteria bacterium]|nr:transglycosylase domain-containing protein [Candidatus Gracilibacteria bacterium]
MKKIFSSLIIFSLFLISGYFSIVFFLPLDIPPLPSSTIFLDSKGQEIGEVIYSGSIRHRKTTSEEIPDFYKKSLIALEDTTFWTNNGISLRGIVRSTLHNIRAGKVVEGGSTLSSGLIRNTFWIGEDRTIGKKILEFLYAIRLNRLYPKDRILTEYIDRVGFGYLNQGLGSAAKYYFGREPKNLTKAEQIALLILPKDSRRYDPYKKPQTFRSRFEFIVDVLEKKQIITADEQKNILLENLAWNMEHGNSLPYVSDFLIPLSNSLLRGERTKNEIFSPLLLGEGLGGEVRTTFDLALTEQIDTIAKNTLAELAWKNVGDYGILIAERTDPESRIAGSGGRSNPLLRVMIGGADYRESVAGQVNTTLALRQPGSAIKPFTYALAFEKLSFTPESTILDLPIAYKTSENYAYEPKNYSQSYKGEITLRQALSESVNIPAIKLTEQLGVSTLLDFLRGLGITSLTKDADHYGLGLTLGNGEVSLFELLQAYTIFTNSGQYCPFQIKLPPLSNSLLEGERTIRERTQGNNTPPLLLGEGSGVRGEEGSGKELIDEVKNCHRAIDKKYTDMVVSILSDRYAKLGGFPLYSALDFPDRNVAVKTGTSRNFRDNWAIGFTDRYMIGVWTGNKSGENMKGVTGATGAGEIFRRIVYALEKKVEEQAPTKPQIQEQEYLTITNPLEDSLYRQTGKDTEKERIQLRFETNIPYDTAQWVLDGRKTDTEFIEPTPGNHIIEIILMKDGSITRKEKNTFRVEGVQ